MANPICQLVVGLGFKYTADFPGTATNILHCFPSVQGRKRSVQELLFKANLRADVAHGPRDDRVEHGIGLPYLLELIPPSVGDAA